MRHNRGRPSLLPDDAAELGVHQNVGVQHRALIRLTHRHVGGIGVVERLAQQRGLDALNIHRAIKDAFGLELVRDRIAGNIRIGYVPCPFFPAQHRARRAIAEIPDPQAFRDAVPVDVIFRENLVELHRVAALDRAIVLPQLVVAQAADSGYRAIIARGVLDGLDGGGVPAVVVSHLQQIGARRAVEQVANDAGILNRGRLCIEKQVLRDTGLVNDATGANDALHLGRDRRNLKHNRLAGHGVHVLDLHWLAHLGRDRLPALFGQSREINGLHVAISLGLGLFRLPVRAHDAIAHKQAVVNRIVQDAVAVALAHERVVRVFGGLGGPAVVFLAHLVKYHHLRRGGKNPYDARQNP